MTKQELLAELQNDAREIASLEKWFISNGESRLAEYASISRLINFKFQDILLKVSQNEFENNLMLLHLDLISCLEYFRDERVVALSDLYGVAVDSFRRLHNKVLAYITQKSEVL